MSADAASTADPVISRYSALARTVQAGGAIADCDPDASAAGCFGAAAYPGGLDASGVPGAALRASLGCGNPLAVASLNPGEIVLDLGSGGGLDVLLSARRVGPAGTAYGLDASADMLSLARATAAQAGVTNAVFAGVLSFTEYHDGLTQAGFTAISISPTHQVAPGMHSGIIRAAKP